MAPFLSDIVPRYWMIGADVSWQYDGPETSVTYYPLVWLYISGERRPESALLEYLTINSLYPGYKD
jgi:hypothetical protein